MFIFPVGTKNIKIGAHKEQYSSRVCWKWNFPMNLRVDVKKSDFSHCLFLLPPCKTRKNAYMTHIIF